MNTILVIMAAGMGTRYGGLKQLEPIGPNGEAIIDFLVYDAVKTGFDRVVFIIREIIVPDFESFLENRYPKDIKIELVLQENTASINPQRSKPWGTAHAVLAVEKLVQSPFAIINADDFYGRDAFAKAFSFLNQKDSDPNMQALIGYRLSDTLSLFGSVSRGVCEVNKKQELTHVREILNIENSDSGKIYYKDETGTKQFLNPEILVSMNFWCFQPGIFNHLGRGFSEFLTKNKNNTKAEYQIPEIINKLVEKNIISVKAESTAGPWFGITYKEDKANVWDSILKLTQSGIYPSPLWK